MGWLDGTINSSIGKKAVMALSGLGLGLFVVVHLAGLSTIFRGRGAFAAYADHLNNLGWLLWPGELLLLLFFLVHIGVGLLLLVENLRARPQRYAVSQRSGATWSSRTMPYSGLFLLLFQACHLAHFHFADPSSLSDLLRAGLAQPATAIFYLTGVLALGLHLGHGLWSSLQSLGVSHPKYDRWLAIGGLGLSAFVTTLFAIIPLLALFCPGFLR